MNMDIDASEVTVEVHEGKVTLEGTVPERWMKHTIEDIADGCWGVQDVENRIRVQSGSGSSAGESDSQRASSGSSSSDSSSARPGSSTFGSSSGSSTSSSGSSRSKKE
jgi:hypothetical protein